MPFIQAPTIVRGRAGQTVSVSTLRLGATPKITTRIFLRTAVVQGLLGEIPSRPTGLILAIGTGEDAGKVMLTPPAKNAKANIRVRPTQSRDQFVVEGVALPTTLEPMAKAAAEFEFQGPALVITLPFGAQELEEELSL